MKGNERNGPLWAYLVWDICFKKRQCEPEFRFIKGTLSCLHMALCPVLEHPSF